MSNAITNYVTPSTKAEMIAASNRINTALGYLTDIGLMQADDFYNWDFQISGILNASSAIETVYSQIAQAGAMQFSNSLLDFNESESVTALVGALSSVIGLRDKFINVPNDDILGKIDTGRALFDELIRVGGLTADFSTMLGEIGKSWSIQDRVFFEYSRAGESELNDQLGQLGDALDQLAQVIQITNSIEMALSINPVSSTGASQVNSEGLLASGYATAAPASFMINTVVNGSATTVCAARYVYDALQSLTTIKDQFTDGTAIKNAITSVITDLTSAGVNTTTSPTWSGATSATVGWPTTAFKAFWENTTLRQDVNNLQTTLSSQNDVQKQNLRQAMFIYQEFIKSASLVMDRVYDAIKDIASRIAR